MACFAVPFLIVWAWTFSSQMRFLWAVAPAALTEWAGMMGFEVEQRSAPVLPQGPFMWTAGPFRRVYRITVRDRDGHRRHGWVRLGRNLWPSSTVENCPVDVQWDS